MMNFGRWDKVLVATLLAGMVAGSADAAPKKMKMSSFVPPTHMLTALMQDFVKELSAASNGEVEIEYFGAEALGKADAQGLPGEDLYREYVKALEAMDKPVLVKLPELLK